MLCAVVFEDAIVALFLSTVVQSERFGSSSIAFREHRAWGAWAVGIYLHA